MRIIVPMAGLGKRMRPHTLTTPKPLLEIAGKPIIYRLIADISEMIPGSVEEISFIIGKFGEEVERELCRIAEELGMAPRIYYQYEALGTAHALYMAKNSLKGNVLVAYADTLFHTGFKADIKEDAYIWVKKIDNPSQFGVVETDPEGYISRFVEKPKTFVSDLAIIGIYYFREAEILADEIEYLIQNNITGNGEFQLTDALERMMKQGLRIRAAEVSGWYDCGNKNAVLSTHREILNLGKYSQSPENLFLSDAKITGPCFLGDNVRIINAEIGPYVSVGNGTIIENSRIENSIIYQNSSIKNSVLSNSMIGSFVKYHNVSAREVNLGDFSELI